MFNSVRGQAWGMDLVIATFIFSAAVVILFLYSFNNSETEENTLESLSFDGRVISNSILSEGYPVDWNESSVVELGILTDGKINNSKLSIFRNFTRDNYSEVSRVLNTNFEFYFFLDQNMTVDGETVDGIGKPGFNRYNITSRNLIKIERIAVYNNRPVGAKLYVWEE